MGVHDNNGRGSRSGHGTVRPDVTRPGRAR
jgi:hypothetical protein